MNPITIVTVKTDTHERDIIYARTHESTMRAVDSWGWRFATYTDLHADGHLRPAGGPRLKKGKAVK